MLLIAAYFIQGFNAPKCEHVYVEVEQATLKIEQPGLSFGGQVYQDYWPTGKQEGKELICVKCFHIQKQVVDYGEPAKPSAYWPPVNGTNCCDSIKLFISGSSGAVLLKGGVLQVDTTGIHKIITHAY
jgi:hypothetical protein